MKAQVNVVSNTSRLVSIVLQKEANATLITSRPIDCVSWAIKETVFVHPLVALMGAICIYIYQSLP